MNKPVFLIGNGCRGNPDLVRWLVTRNIPVLVTWMAMDLVPEDCPAFCGRPGVLGQRAANIIQQKADRLYCFGARLDPEQVAYSYERFAPRAEKVVYDVDEAELEKLPDDCVSTRPQGRDQTEAGWLKILIDLSVEGPAVPYLEDSAWLNWCRGLYERFRGELEGRDETTGDLLDPHVFMAALSEAAQPDDVLAIGSSSGAVNAFLQSFKVKRGQRITVCATIGAMGADVPMATGAAVATGRRVICVTGDGGFQLNAQELATVKRLKLPITFFVFENGGYGSIAAMQDSRFAGRRVGADEASGFTKPDCRDLALAYGVDADILLAKDDLENILSFAGPMVWAVPTDPTWRQYPRVGSTMTGGVYQVDAMEDMTPKLDPDELSKIMEWDGDTDTEQRS